MLISYEYIRGLIDGEGCFTFCSSPNSRGGKFQIPAFILRMNFRDRALIESICDTLNLKNEVRTYYYPEQNKKDGINRQPVSNLIVRDFFTLRDKIIPLFYKSLHGYKGIQFKAWMEKMETDPLVPRDYKLLAKLYKNGYFEEKAKKFH